jgi:hypothetical protein
MNAMARIRRKKGFAHLNNLGLLFKIRMKMVVALIHHMILARRSSPNVTVKGMEDDMT